MQNTSLSPRHVRNGLGVLIQENLLYHHTSPGSRGTRYEANPFACYNLVRYGKILEVVDCQYGPAERDVVQTLMLLGHVRIADLTQAFKSRFARTKGATNGTSVESEGSPHSALARLLQAEILETVRPDSFRNPIEVFREIEADITKTAPGEKASTKNKAEQQRQIADRFRAFKDQSRVLKRQLDQSQGFISKRRKLHNGASQTRHTGNANVAPLNVSALFPSPIVQPSDLLKPNIVVRLNHEKCLVELRNQRLASFAAETLGEATGSVYRVLLGLLTAQVPNCRPDTLLEESPEQEMTAVTTLEILDNLDEDILLGGIGKAPKDKIDLRSAEKIRTAPHDPEYDSDDSEDELPVRPANGYFVEDDEGDDSDASDVAAHNKQNGGSINGERPAKVKFEDGSSTKDTRLARMRQHLLLLAESKYRFVRHCGTVARGQWTVDFAQVMDNLREVELDAFIEQSFGRYGLRLTRILREKGKLDEKMLHTAALMRKSDVQGKMLAMQMAGIVDVQEVPKDNMRLANRTLFFWFFDSEKTRSHLLDDMYKAMLRCLQTLQGERHKERNILSFVDRKDVQGKEEEVMTAEHYNKFNRHLEVQDKLLGQVMRLDDIVGVFRDF